jgi:hypothetical protein
MDLMVDMLADGRGFPTLNIVEDFTREVSPSKSTGPRARHGQERSPGFWLGRSTPNRLGGTRCDEPIDSLNSMPLVEQHG